jgi:hypothetical protein
LVDIFESPQQQQQQPFEINLYQNLMKETLTVKEPETKFFAPIPIPKAKTRYGAVVPKFVIELARKLKEDRDVQGKIY